jgi:transcriptional regulator NrdR family protein
MVCVHCGHATGVINSRGLARTNRVWRRRRCHHCQAVFTTLETTDYSSTWLVRGVSGRLEPFLRDKLYLSLHASCRHRQTVVSDAAALTDTVIKKLLTQARDGVIERAVIIRAVQVALNRFDKAASVQYQAFHP